MRSSMRLTAAAIAAIGIVAGMTGIATAADEPTTPPAPVTIPAVNNPAKLVGEGGIEPGTYTSKAVNFCFYQVREHADDPEHFSYKSAGQGAITVHLLAGNWFSSKGGCNPWTRVGDVPTTTVQPTSTTTPATTTTTAPAAPGTIPGSTQTNPMLVIGESYLPGAYASQNTFTPGGDACDFEAVRVITSTDSTETIIHQRPNPTWNRSGQATVNLKAGDRFRSANCGSWVRTGDVLEPSTSEPTPTQPQPSGANSSLDFPAFGS